METETTTKKHQIIQSRRGQKDLFFFCCSKQPSVTDKLNTLIGQVRQTDSCSLALSLTFFHSQLVCLIHIKMVK